MSVLPLLAYMLAAHALCDYPLQGDWLSKAKNPKLDLVPGERIWPMALAGHALIQAAAVQLITGSWSLFVVAFIVPVGLDDSNCRGRFGYNVDQYLHVLCKVIYALAILALGPLP
jgi:hypothetical protein